MWYAESPPPPELSGLVRCFWHLEAPAPAGDQADPALPDGSPELIFSLGDAFEQVLPDGNTRRQPAAFLVGQITRPMVVRATGGADLIAVRFEAHGAFVLHQDMKALTDRWLPIDDLPGNPLDGIVPALRLATTPESRERVLATALDRLRDERKAPDPRVAAAVRAIRTSHGAVSLDTMAKELGLTIRSLQRLFGQQVGISPKVLARIVRFQRVFACWRDEPANLARVAADCGYFDQSHLVRDFRDFAGEAPAKLRDSLSEFTAFFTASRPAT